MTHVTCRLTVKNRDQLRDPTLGSRVWTTFSSQVVYVWSSCGRARGVRGTNLQVPAGLSVRRGRRELSADWTALCGTHVNDRPTARSRAGRRRQVPLGRHQGDHGHRRPPHHNPRPPTDHQPITFSETKSSTRTKFLRPRLRPRQKPLRPGPITKPVFWLQC